MIKRIAFVASWIVAILAVTGIAWALNGSGDTDPGTPAEVAMIDDGTTTTTSQPGSGFVDDGSDDGFVDDGSDDGFVDDGSDDGFVD
ncbi:MAG: hypothetical protein KQH83_09945, partial [Actinobacteria bacterium]|nr:hypothetical protein [Actinomycetota bacterium]